MFAVKGDEEMNDYRKWLQAVAVLVLLAVVALLIVSGGCEQENT
jgi:hypothetical protein